MYKYASAEFFRKEHTLRKATAPREAGDEVNGPSPTAGWGAVDPGHSHVWVTDVRGGGAAGDGAPWNTGPRGGDGGGASDAAAPPAPRGLSLLLHRVCHPPRPRLLGHHTPSH